MTRPYICTYIVILKKHSLEQVQYSRFRRICAMTIWTIFSCLQSYQLKYWKTRSQQFFPSQQHYLRHIQYVVYARYLVPTWYRPMRSKARGLVQRGGPPGWLKYSDPARFCTWWTGRTACLFRTVPVALTEAALLRADGISSCCYIVNVHNHPSCAMSWKEGMSWYFSRPLPSLW
jgi:hypothetical protein